MKSIGTGYSNPLKVDAFRDSLKFESREREPKGNKFCYYNLGESDEKEFYVVGLSLKNGLPERHPGKRVNLWQFWKKFCRLRQKGAGGGPREFLEREFLGILRG